MTLNDAKWLALRTGGYLGSVDDMAIAYFRSVSGIPYGTEKDFWQTYTSVRGAFNDVKYAALKALGYVQLTLQEAEFNFWINLVIGGGGPFFLMQEDGTFLLQEDGTSKIIL